MQFIRTVQKAHNGTIVIELPAELANEEVEIIVLPTRSSSEEGTKTPQQVSQQENAVYERARQRFLHLDTSEFTQQHLDAYNKACERLLEGRQPGEPRILGLTAGVATMSDDFNEPLPDEYLFYEGESTAPETDIEAPI